MAKRQTCGVRSCDERNGRHQEDGVVGLSRWGHDQEDGHHRLWGAQIALSHVSNPITPAARIHWSTDLNHWRRLPVLSGPSVYLESQNPLGFFVPQRDTQIQFGSGVRWVHGHLKFTKKGFYADKLDLGNPMAWFYEICLTLKSYRIFINPFWFSDEDIPSVSFSDDSIFYRKTWCF